MFSDQSANLVLHERQIDPYIWELHAQMKRFVKELAPFVKYVEEGYVVL